MRGIRGRERSRFVRDASAIYNLSSTVLLLLLHPARCLARASQSYRATHLHADEVHHKPLPCARAMMVS